MPEYFFNDVNKKSLHNRHEISFVFLSQDEHLTDADIVDAETDSEIFDKKFIEAQLYDRMNE